MAGLLLGVLLGWTGWLKLTAPAAESSALVELLHDTRLVRRALRTLGAVELAVAAGLLGGLAAAGWAAAALGVGFLGYLAWARAVAPDASCGCASARHTPVTARSFGRAGLVVLAGSWAAVGRPWWTVEPLAAAVTAAAGLALVLALSADLDHLWLLPLRRARLRLLGHPLSTSDGGNPVAASVQLLESSLAWESAAGVVRSALLESWDDAGWRFLRFAGVAAGRPVTVVFALAAESTVDTVTDPVVRVTVVDDERQEVVGDLLPLVR
ncbi:MAG TPA: MauE/DoxX family redox-associated membrane protein [Mycobacteriales bacterium]|nr:MauE/DoxX family redox-associated membrane protein [Mycobacteriales bacterium]